jgi:four helix bundle protein
MGDFRQLKVWQRAHALTLEVYRVTRGFPPEERYELSSQLRRAAASVESNICEGSGRRTEGEFRQFLSVARGSIREVEGQLLIARDLGYLTLEQWAPMAKESQRISRMLTKLILTLLPRRPTI